MVSESKPAHGIDATFSLIDHEGERVTERSFRGRYLMVFFGFSHCRVVCPRNLDRISVVLGHLGQLADRIRPLYITVDPARDTPNVLKAFLQSRYPRFLGLTGSTEEIDAAKRSFRVFAQRKEDRSDPQGYAVPHSAITYLIGPDGGYLAHFTDGVDETQLVGRLRAFLPDIAATGSVAVKRSESANPGK
jgi:protein SCO1/2